MRTSLGIVGRCVALGVLLGTAAGGVASAASTERVRGYLEDGRKLLAHNEPNSAAILFRKAVEADPGNGEAQYDLAMALFKTPDQSDVETHLHAAATAGYNPDEIAVALADLYLLEGKYGKILDELPEGDRRKDLEARIRTARGYAQLNLRQTSDAEVAFRHGIALAQTGLAQTRIINGDLAGAAALLQQANDTDPKLVDPWILLGRVRSLQNDPAAARAAFDKAILLAPGSTIALLDRASLIIETDEKQAASDVAAVLDLAPDDRRANVLDAVIKARQEKWHDAEATLMGIPALEQTPKALYLLARVNLAQGQLDQADANITHFLAITPGDPQGLGVKAAVLLHRNMPSNAIDLLQQALAVTPDDATLLGLLSSAYRQNKQNKEAAATLDRLSAIAPRDVPTRLQLAQQRIAVGEIDAALGDLAIARALEPNSTKTTTVAIEAFLAANALDKAEETAEAYRVQDPENPVPEVYLGLVALRRESIPAARRHFEKALVLRPNFATASLNLAQTYRAERRLDEARTVYDRALQQDPKNMVLLMARVEMELAADKPDAAIAWLEQARSADPSAEQPRLELVRIYLEQKETAKAVAVGHELERIAPRDPRAITALAEAQLANNDRQTALATFDKVVYMTGNASEPLLRLAGVLAMGGDVQGGYRLVRKALDANPLEEHVQQAMLEFSVKTGTVGASIPYVQELIGRRPDAPSLNGLLGQLYEADGKYERAVAAYQAGLAKGESGLLVRGIARAQAHVTTPEATLAPLQGWLDKHPDDRATRLVYASLLEDAKHEDRAQIEFERLLADGPKDPALLNNLAWLYSLKSDPRALQFAEDAYALAPESPVVADTLGWILVQDGKTERGLTLLQSAAAASPGAGIRYHLAVALSKAGRRDDAVRVLGELLKSDARFNDRNAAQALMAKLTG